MQDLALRKTRKYVGTCSHLDEWDSIGGFEVLESKSKLLDDEDICQPTETVLHVRVTSAAADKDISQALRDSNSKVGCHHEYDCCGCVSTYATSAVKNPDGTWTVKLHSSRNY